LVNIIPDISVGDIGTRLRIRLTKVKDGIPRDQITGEPDQREPVDLTTSTAVFVEVETPRGRRLPLLPANIEGDPKLGIFSHLDTVGIFDRDGRYKHRGVADFDSGARFHGTWTGFPVGN